MNENDGNLLETDDDLLDRQLAQLEEGESLDADSTIRALRAELETLAEELRQPPPANPFEDESACQRVNELVRAIGREPSFAVEETIGGDAVGTEHLPSLGHYKLLEKLGEGGMGAVYKALHTRLRRIVALKILPPDRVKNAAAIDRFDREMQAVGQLNHPNIVAAHDAGEVDGRHYLVMELVDGVDLSVLIRRTGPLSVAHACELVRQAAVGLQEAHEHGMVHRDIKPSNLMLAQVAGGRKPPLVKILDLGLALLDDKNSPNESGLTTSGQMMGTIDYMAPEQVSDSHAVDIRADLYSLGATLFRLLTGEPPFSGEKYDTPIKTLRALGVHDAPSIATRRKDLPVELVAVVDRMLDKNPDNRFATPQQVANALAPLAEGADLAMLLRRAITDDAASDQDPSTTETVDLVASGSQDTTPRYGNTIESTSDLAVPVGQSVDAAGSSPATTQSARSLRASWQKISPTARFALAAALGGVILLAGILLTIRTPKGEVIVELADGIKPEEVRIEVAGDGDLKVIDAESNWTIEVAEGKYDVRLASGKDRFKLDRDSVLVTRNERMRVRVTLKPVADTRPSGNTDPDRMVAEWVLGIGGHVDIKHDKAWPERASTSYYGQRLTRVTSDQRELPQQPFEIHSVSLNCAGSDAGEVDLSRIGGLEAIRMLALVGPFTDDQLATLPELPSLTEVLIQNDPIIGDGGVGQLQRFPQLKTVKIFNAEALTDVSAKHLAQIKTIESLDLRGAQVTDAWLLELAALENLRDLSVQPARVTAVGIAKLRAMLPECKIGSDFSEEDIRLAGQAHGVDLPKLRWQPGPVENVLPGIIPRPADLPGTGRWQVLEMPLDARVWLSPDANYLAWTRAEIGPRFLVVQEVESRRPVAVAPLSGHHHAAEWSPDSRIFAVTTTYEDEPAVHLVTLDGKPPITKSLEQPGWPLKWSPDSRTLAIAFRDARDIWLIDSDGQRGPVLKGHEDYVNDLAWSADGKRLVSAGNDKAVRIWQADGTPESVLPGHASAALCVDWSADGNRIVSGAKDEVRFWQPDGTPGPVVKLERAISSNVKWSPDSSLVYVENSVGANEPRHILSANGEVVATTTDAGKNATWSPDSNWIARTWSSGTHLLSRDGKLGQEFRAMNAHMVWNRDGTRLCVAGQDRTVQWHGVDGTEYPKSDGPRAVDRNFDTAWSADGKHLAISGGHENYPVWVWSDEGQLEWTARQGNPSEVSSFGGLDWSPDSRSLAVAGHLEKLRLWNLDGTPGMVLDGHDVVAWSPDGRWIAVSRKGKPGVQLWKPDGTQGLVFEKGIGPAVLAIKWSPDGQQIAVGSESYEPIEVDGKQYSTGKLLSLHHVDGTTATIVEHYAPKIAWSPDGKRFATGLSNVNLWNADGTPGPPLQEKAQHGGLDFFWSSDSQSLTAIQGPTTANYVNRWGVDGKLQDRSEPLPYGEVWYVAEFTSDGKRLAARRRTGVVDVVDTETGDIQWSVLPLCSGDTLGFTPAGQLTHAPPEVAAQLIYVVERPDGTFLAMNRADFFNRISLPPAEAALLWVREAGGTVSEVEDGSGLMVNLSGNKHVEPADFERLAAIETLTALDVSGTEFSDRSLGSIAELPSLQSLRLDDTKVTSNGLKQIARLKMLTSLGLDKTLISNGGLAHLGSLVQLRELHLAGTSITDFGLPHLSGLSKLEVLDLSGTVVGDAGLDALKSLTNLEHLNLATTGVTPAGVEQLQAVLTDCAIRFGVR